jgi:hypothetical protein
MAKAEISWNRVSEDGVKRQAYAHHIGDRWIFYARPKRFEEWEEVKAPDLDDWLELLDGVRRRINRRLVRPEEEARVIKRIHELFPDADIPSS